MRITREQLQEMIREGVAEELRRTPVKHLVEVIGEPGGSLSELDPSDLLDFGDAYVRLGREGRRVLKMLVDDPDEVGDDAEVEVDMIENELGTMNQMIDAAIADWRSREPQS